MVYKKTFGKVVFDIINVIVLTFIAAMCLMPLLHVLFSSLSDPTALARNEGVVLWPLGQPTLKGYELVFQNPNIVQGYGNTLFYVTVGTLLGTFMTALCGYVLSRRDILYKNYLTFFVTFTMMFSGGLIPFYMVVRNLGWIDKRIALIVPGSISVFNVIVMRTAFMGIPVSLEESAKLDGAGHMVILFNIILPLSKAVIAVIVLFVAVSHWNSWFFAMIFIQTRALYPLQLILREILVQNDTSKVMVGSDAVAQMDLYKPLVQYCTTIVATLPILMIYPFVQKYFVTGVMIGSLKG
jgi:putative aldouronate transport system permease protein